MTASNKVSREELRKKRAEKITSRPRRINVTSQTPKNDAVIKEQTTKTESIQQQAVTNDAVAATLFEASQLRMVHIEEKPENNQSLEETEPQQEPKLTFSQRKKEEALNKRREKFEKKRKELLQSAISKLKTYQQSSDETNQNALTSLEKSISSKTDTETNDGLSGNVTTAVSEQDVLNAASQNLPTETANAKDRFKRVLQGKGLILNEVVESNPDLKAHQKYVTSNAFKRKLELRKRNQKKVSEYLEKTGLIFQDNNFEILLHKISDSMLINIESISNLYRIACSKLAERAKLAIRSGDSEHMSRKKKYDAQEVVGEIFSEFQIANDKEHIVIDAFKDNNSVKMPKENFDIISQEILKEHLYYDGKQSFITPNINHSLKELEHDSSIVTQKEIFQKEDREPVIQQLKTPIKTHIPQQIFHDTHKIETTQQSTTISTSGTPIISQKAELKQPTTIMSFQTKQTMPFHVINPSIATQKPKIMNVALKNVLKNSLKNANFNFKKANLDSLRSKLKALANKENMPQK